MSLKKILMKCKNNTFLIETNSFPLTSAHSLIEGNLYAVKRRIYSNLFSNYKKHVSKKDIKMKRYTNKVLIMSRL